MHRSLIGGESSSSITSHKRNAVADAFDDDPPPPSSPLDRTSFTSDIIKLPVELIAGLILPFVADRVTWNSVCFASKELHRAENNLTPPWPNTTLRIGGSRAIVSDVVFSPCGSHLAFRNTERDVVHVMDRWGKETILECRSTRFVSRLVYSMDGKYLASNQDTSIRIWNTNSFHTKVSRTSMERSTWTLEQYRTSVMSFSRTDSNLLAAGGKFGEIKLWNVQDETCIHSFNHDNYPSHICSLNFLGGESSACNAVFSNGSFIRLWRAEESSDFASETIAVPRFGPQYHGDNMVGADFSPCGSFLTTNMSTTYKPEYGTAIALYDLETMIKIRSGVILDFIVICSGVAPDCKTLVLGDGEGRIRLVQTDDFSIQRSLDIISRSTICRGPKFTFDPTCRVLAFACCDGVMMHSFVQSCKFLSGFWPDHS